MFSFTNVQGITRALHGVWYGCYGLARCPAHDDQLPSLSITNGNDGRLLLTCYAGCSFREIIQALTRIGLLGKQAFLKANGCKTDQKPADDAGRKADFTLAKRAYSQGFEVFIMQAPKGTDFNDFLYHSRYVI
ncbi:toprim domain-containing protein [Bartonella sp. B1099]|uniref:toprim domain-containing protein n=1 Tax=Bartonella sp. B1099 TaxID=2911422 RepID=UPI0020C27AC3|nr:toprim domain-containing protein [Bartonella sp. B1099]